MNILDALCPSRDVFVDLADKWVLLMLASLREFGERDGIVLRTVDVKMAPPLVLYELTELGREIAEETRALCTWTEKRTATVYEARAAYDRRQAAD